MSFRLIFGRLFLYLRACLYGGGGPQVGELPALEINPPLHATLQPLHAGLHFLKIIE